MTKFDHAMNLPEIFKKNQLSILPTSRGSYVIAKLKTYQEIKYDNKKPITFTKRTDLESLDYSNIYSESAAINCAFLSGIIYDVTGEKCELTVNGRMSSRNFNFKIELHDENEPMTVEVDNSQCEIDAGFEGETKLILLEAKNMTCDDFLIRQIYYPFRLWKNKISKKVIPVFMTYSNNIFSFFIYDFTEEDNYNSIKLIEQKHYVIEPEEINIEDVKDILKSTELEQEPKIPFPQADKFERVVDLTGLIMNKQMTKDEVTSEYIFDERQTNYYTDAARYLGLVEKFKDEQKSTCFKLTENAKKIMLSNYRDKNLALIKCILRHKPFREALKYYLEKSESPNIEQVVGFMKKSNLYKVGSNETYKRRAQTVIKWVEWIIKISREEY